MDGEELMRAILDSGTNRDVEIELFDGKLVGVGTAKFTRHVHDGKTVLIPAERLVTQEEHEEVKELLQAAENEKALLEERCDELEAALAVIRETAEEIPARDAARLLRGDAEEGQEDV